MNLPLVLLRCKNSKKGTLPKWKKNEPDQMRENVWVWPEAERGVAKVVEQVKQPLELIPIEFCFKKITDRHRKRFIAEIEII